MYDEQIAHYVVATCIIVKDKKFLIAKRSDQEKRWPGRWTVPGGKLEKRDYNKRKHDTKSGQWYNVLEDLARREVFEETGLLIKDITYLTNLSFIRPDNIPTLVISLLAKHEKGEVNLSPELTEHAWVTLEEAKNYDLIEGIYEELEMAHKKLKS